MPPLPIIRSEREFLPTLGLDDCVVKVESCNFGRLRTKCGSCILTSSHDDTVSNGLESDLLGQFG